MGGGRGLKWAIGNAGSKSRALIFITKNEKLPKRRQMWAQKNCDQQRNSNKKERSEKCGEAAVEKTTKNKRKFVK